jgi:hypothetical protein
MDLGCWRSLTESHESGGVRGKTLTAARVEVLVTMCNQTFHERVTLPLENTTHYYKHGADGARRQHLFASSRAHYAHELKLLHFTHTLPQCRNRSVTNTTCSTTNIFIHASWLDARCLDAGTSDHLLSLHFSALHLSLRGEGQATRATCMTFAS